MAVREEQGGESSACYQLMEDGEGLGLDGRCMTMPAAAPVCGVARSERSRSPPARAASFTSSTTGASFSTASEDTAAVCRPNGQPPQNSQAAEPPADRPIGILRQSALLDGVGRSSGRESPQRRRRIKKKVSITLPGSSKPVVSSRRLERRRDFAAATLREEAENANVVGGGGERPEAVVIEAEVYENAEATGASTAVDEEEESARESAAGLLNGGHVAEAQPSEQTPIFLREGSQRISRSRSIRESLTSSLSRLGNRMKRRKPPKLQRLQSTLDFDKLAENELELKANLYWHIGTPIKRWKVERQVPIKLVWQLLKTFVLIVQVILFTETIAHMRGEFFFDTRIVFESAFITDFDPERVLQKQTLYSIQDVSAELELIALNYYRLPDIAIGGYDLVRDDSGEPVPLQLSLRQYREAILNASDSRFVLDGHIDDIEFNFTRSLHSNLTERLFGISQDPHFHKFVEMRVKLPVNVIRIEAPQQAECFRFNIEIVFTNDNHNGKIFYELRTQYFRINSCRGEILRDKTGYKVIKGALLVLDLIMLKFCLVSLFLTGKTLFRAYKLGKAMGRFYHHQLHLPLSWWERRSLFSKWHYVNILSDIIISSGTIFKILLEFDVVLDASPARIMLGTALLFQAAVILRYLNYFRQVNALTRTLALAFPELVKFILCGAVLFFAFSLCGWIVLGPFHPKFTTIVGTIETLFSLLNGDDIYNTYILLEPQVDLAAYIYSRVFLYVFLGLFVYGVLNLFTSLVISAYEISQNRDTAIRNEVRRFVFSGPLTPHGAALRDVTSTSKYVDPAVILNKAQKAQRKGKYSSDDDE